MSVTIRKGDHKDLERFLCFLREVRNTMDHPEWFFLDTPEEIRQSMCNGIMQFWLAVDGERVAAVFNILTPGLRPYNYGYDLGLTKEELLRVVHLDYAAVHPDYRGQGLQRRLIQTAEADISGNGKRILLCTIHPENRFSLQNAQMQGYEIQKELAKYDSVRYILRKDIS